MGELSSSRPPNAQSALERLAEIHRGLDDVLKVLSWDPEHLDTPANHNDVHELVVRARKAVEDDVFGPNPLLGPGDGWLKKVREKLTGTYTAEGVAYRQYLVGLKAYLKREPRHGEDLDVATSITDRAGLENSRSYYILALTSFFDEFHAIYQAVVPSE
jgi:hypothetical protein